MTDKKSYKQLEKELNELLDRVENGDYDQLEDLLKDYDNGTKLIEAMQKRLDSAKNSIKKVK
jgi:exodeoxyribonuclease VII small subunit